MSKRLESIKEYGSDDEEDFNTDGSIKTTGISLEQLHYYTVFQDLYHDCVDIVQDTHPEDLYPLIETKEIEAIAKSDAVYDDQHDLLYAIQNDADAILNLQIAETRFYKERGNGKRKRG